MTGTRLVWHYTSHDVVEKILSTHELRATSIAALNDVTEIRHGNKRVRQAFKRLRHGWDWYDPGAADIDFDDLSESLDSAAYDAFHGSAYVCCFTPAGDDTPQWQKYAGPDGFAIAIPEGVYLPVIGEHAPAPTRSPYIEEFPFRWLELKYDKASQLEAAERAIWELKGGLDEGAYIDAKHEPGDHFGSIFRDRGASAYVDAVAAIKHKDFRSEREVRYAVSGPDNPLAIQSTPAGSDFVRITGAARKPFSTSWDQHDPAYYQSSSSVLPIREIRVGPRNAYTPTKTWLKSVLSANGYHDVKVRPSRSPLR